MANLLKKTFTFFAKGKNKALIDALVRENEKLKSKLNFYVNFYLEDKERWKLTLDLLRKFSLKVKPDDFFADLVKNIAKCTSDANVYLVVYSRDEENKVFCSCQKGNCELRQKKYFENLRYDDVKNRLDEISNSEYEIIKIKGEDNEYGYLFIESSSKDRMRDNIPFIKTLCRHISLAIDHNEDSRNCKHDNQSKVEFLVNFSHELKTPLNGIITYSEFLKAEKEKFDDDIRKYIENINISARQLNYLMIDIAESAKSEYSQLKVIKEKFLTNVEILNILSVFHSKIIEKELRVERILTDVEIYSDIAKFNQILYNLISNAIKFSPHNGKLKLCSWVEKGNFHFEIEDDGCGINERDKDKIFEFLTQASQDVQKEGSGVGLAISKKIVEIQGGKIGYIPKEPLGTIFWFNLPLDGGF